MSAVIVILVVRRAGAYTSRPDTQDTIMRKRYKLKRRSCALCKPYKRGWESRWKAKDRQLLEVAEREMRITAGP